MNLYWIQQLRKQETNSSSLNSARLQQIFDYDEDSQMQSNKKPIWQSYQNYHKEIWI